MKVGPDRITRIENRPSNRRDVVLMCGGCRKPTPHHFSEEIPIGIRIVDLSYECLRCGEHRIFGREDTSSAPDHFDAA